MLLLRAKVLAALLFVFTTSFAQKLKKGDKLIVDNLKKHIGYLADDKLEGRRAGTQGEQLAMDYIIGQFKEIGINPKGTESYPQSFDINDGKEIGSATSFSINNNKLEAPGD